MTYYRIKNWEKLFENNRTRELKTMAWVPMPNKMDGDGYTQIFEHKNGLEIFAIWVLCVEVASRCDPRGTLLRDGEKTHDFSSLARITRAPRKSFELAIPVLVEIGWLEQLTKNTAGECEVTAPSCTEGKGMEGKGMEGKGMEGKGMEGKGMEGNTLSEGDRLISETLAAIITNSKNINITASKITAWAKEIHKLREIDGVPDKRISLALDWYKDHIGEQYTPVIESGSSLREKFINLEDAIKRSTEHGQPKQRDSGEYPEDIKVRVI